MQDIRKPLKHSKSKREISQAVESFERQDYSSESSRELRSRDVTIKSHSRPRYSRAEAINLYPEYRKPQKYTHTERSKRSYWYIGLSILVLVLVYVYTYIFNTAVLTVVPKYKDLQISNTVVLSEQGDVPFVIATTTITQTKKLPKGEKTTVETKATGEIIVYNNYSATSQRLIKNTRFESPDGKIFRIQESIVVPGKKGSTPGSIKTKVYADTIGDAYNIAPTDFTLPAFKGSDKYTLFYARAVKAFTGGASGARSVVATSDINAAKDELAIALNTKMKDQLQSVKKDGYIGLYDIASIVITDNESDISSGKTDEYSATATGYVAFVEEEALAKQFAETQSQYKGEHVRLDGADALHFTLEKGASIVASSTFSVLVEGPSRVVWVVDGEKLRQSLVGKTKTELAGVISSTPEVDSANVSMRPFWVSSFPDHTGSISIVEKLPVLKS